MENMNNDQTPEEEVDIDEKTLTNEDDLEGTDDDEVESEKDYKVKFSESTRENQRIMTENKKLQEQLEALKNPDIKIKGKEADEAFYRKEGWKPQSYEDLQKAILEAEKRGKEGAVEYFKNQLDAQKKADEVIDNFIEEKSKEDKTFDEDTFFKFIKKHEIEINNEKGLEKSYRLFKEIISAKEKGMDEALKNKDKRSKEGVSSPKSGANETNKTSWQEVQKSGSIRDIALSAFRSKK